MLRGLPHSFDRQDCHHGARHQQSHSHRPSGRGSRDARHALGHDGREPALATTESWKDKQSGEQQERTEWHNVALFGRLAEIAGEYLRKGSQVYIEGRLRTRKWQDKEGRDRYTTEIVGNEMQMLGGRGGGGGGASRAVAAQAARPRAARWRAGDAGRPAGGGGGGGDGDFDDDIPF